ncbi:MAG: DUF3179 domain-containing (seleno)protein [Verrucomicrobia bacterium]|nr:DUF3179 domain-containing (seleno)protein [Verrucomicrobiota bacterium]
MTAPASEPGNHERQSPSSACGKDCGSRRRRGILFGILGVALAALAVQYLRDPESFRWPEEDASEAFFAGGSGGGSHTKNTEKIIEKEGRRLLWAGADEAMHFDVTQTALKLERLHYGLGREAFPALIQPRFVTAKAASQWLPADARVLAVKIGDEHKVYPVALLIRHEVVNDVVGGQPVFAAYCILADLGAVYDRKLGGHTLTFGVSGYTYSEADIWSGLDAFVLWDRETESLWWPPSGVAVSGSLKDQSLRLLATNLWQQTTWGKVSAQNPNVLVLDQGQDFARPTNWARLPPELGRAASAGLNAIAPRWGQNP